MQRLRRVIGLIACLALAFGLGGIATAKKKQRHRGHSRVVLTSTASRPIPDATPGPHNSFDIDGVLRSTVAPHKKQLRGARVADVNVTLQTLGSTTGSAGDLVGELTGPTGITVGVFFREMSGQSIGPVTFDDETPARLCLGSDSPPPPPCGDPDQVLTEPYRGTARPDFSLSVFDGSRARGPWTLTLLDTSSNPAQTSSLLKWSVAITPADQGRAVK